jgi:hypothetical protein
MIFETREFECFDDFLQWYDQVTDHFLLVYASWGTPIIVRYAQIYVGEVDLLPSELAC